MIAALVGFGMVCAVFSLLMLKDMVSALEKRAKAEEKLAEAHASQAEELKKVTQELNLLRQYYAHAVEKQWDAVR